MQSLVSNRCCFLIVLVLLVMLASISVSNAFKAGGNMQLLTLCVSCVCVGSSVLAGAVDPGIVWYDARDRSRERGVPRVLFCVWSMSSIERESLYPMQCVLRRVWLTAGIDV